MSPPSHSPGPIPRTGTHAHPTLNALAAQVNAAAQWLFDPTGREHTLMTLSPEVVAGDVVRYRASVWVSQGTDPLVGSGETPLAAVLALLDAVESHARQTRRRGPGER